MSIRPSFLVIGAFLDCSNVVNGIFTLLPVEVGKFLTDSLKQCFFFHNSDEWSRYALSLCGT